ncbi:prolyl oligopeptidase family serine peptidase [Leucothrix arctica]|uniref:S9 family peptidase n=1 Tax=Leucothrix arctica TaxID=1481894 RepID=A0A317CBT9_9GAMM|nr:prolyl oligopeptidase family serine peptidase [Leucothrix arctica]PWQ96155.1 S9 family peptidase [Leucothrix arctica]
MTQIPDLDSHLYLEEVLGDKALTKVRAWNETAKQRLESDPRFKAMEADANEIANSKDKIPFVSYRNGKLFNFWQDEDHVRGILRSTNLDSYMTNEPVWETILDIDALAKEEDKNWVFAGTTTLSTDESKCLVNLSDGGKDASLTREFDAVKKCFVEDGFITEESKGNASWLDENTLLIAVDFGKGSMTDSGYPMISKLWKRGTDLADATELMRGEQTDVYVYTYCMELSNGQREIMVHRAVTFFTSETYWLPADTLEPVKLPIPEKSSLNSEFKGQLLLTLNEDWRDFKSGDLLSFSVEDFMKTGEIAELNLVYSPNERTSIGSISATRSKLLISLFENVAGQAYSFDWDGKAWSSGAIELPGIGSVYITASNDKEDKAFLVTDGFLAPSSLWLYDTLSKELELAKSLPSWFDASSMVVEQFEAASTDGTLIPYFVVRHKDCKLDGKNPTLLYGYGGFEVSLTPSYGAVRGKLWLEQGGVYVQANIRGGGEFGPKWHQAGLKTKRQVVFDDFIAVAEDLIEKKITSPKHLGVQGGSNGGLLVGVMFTQRPDLFNAVICAVPLLDMMRYHTLLAGASWVGEYGNPEDAVEGDFLRSISPYHNVKADMDYPEIFFVTSTKDDRVHPGHARKMAARLEDMSYSFLYYENIDGGHSAAANLKESSKQRALEFTYLLQKLSG